MDPVKIHIFGVGGDVLATRWATKHICMSFALMTDHFHSIHLVERFRSTCLGSLGGGGSGCNRSRLPKHVSLIGEFGGPILQRKGSEKNWEKESKKWTCHKIVPSWQPTNWETIHRFAIGSSFSDNTSTFPNFHWSHTMFLESIGWVEIHVGLGFDEEFNLYIRKSKSTWLGEPIQFDYYFSDELKPPPTRIKSLNKMDHGQRLQIEKCNRCMFGTEGTDHAFSIPRGGPVRRLRMMKIPASQRFRAPLIGGSNRWSLGMESIET